MSRLMLSVLLCLVTMSFVGCADTAEESADRLGRVPATATVNYKGEAVSGATVTLFASSEEGKGAFGLTDSNGKASLGTYESGDGAVPGEYVVTVRKTDAPAAAEDEGEERDEPDDAEEFVPKDLVPSKYKDRATTDLKATITEGGDNDLVFDLTD